MLRFFDQNNKDITDEYNFTGQRHSNPKCPGEPWCSAWGHCAQEPSEQAAGEPERSGLMEQEASGSGLIEQEAIDMLEEIDRIILEELATEDVNNPLLIAAELE